MTDPVEALAAALFNQEPHDCDRDFKVCGGVILAALRASGFDVVPTGDAGLDHAPGCDVFRIAESWEPYGEPRHCDCGFALWDAKRRGVYNWTPPTGDAGLDALREAVMPMFTDWSTGKPTSGWACTNEIADNIRAALRLSSSDTGGPTAQQRSLAEQHERGIHTVPEAWPGCPLCSSSDTGGRDGDVMLDSGRYDY